MSTLTFDSQLYLASPYSHQDRKVRQRRYQLACEFVALASQHDLTVFSPIVHYHQLANTYKLPLDANFWWSTNRRHLLASVGLIVLEIPGWEDSRGVFQEVQFARQHKKVILRGSLLEGSKMQLTFEQPDV